MRSPTEPNMRAVQHSRIDRRDRDQHSCGVRRPRQRGMAVIYVGIMLIVLFGMVSLAVDMGRVRTSKAQLSTAADAGAFAAGEALPRVDHDDARARASAVAGANFCDGAPVNLVPAEDVEFGLYRAASRRYTPMGAAEPGGHVVRDRECNAVKVTPRRIEARGNPIGLTFARVVGKESMDVIATATAYVRGGPRIGGIVGIDWVEMNGTVRTDSYSSEPYDPNNFNHNGTVMSNGTINMVGTADIYGDARPGVESVVDRTPNTDVHGWEAPLEEPLNFPPATVPAGLPNSGQLRVNGGQTYSLAAGEYWFTSVTLRGNSTLVITPQVTMYVTGDIDLTGGTVTNPGTPADFDLIKVGPGEVRLGGGGTLKAHVYAPEADVRIHGTQGGFGLFGWVIGRTLDIQGNSAIHYDETLEGDAGPYRTVLIK